MNRTRRILVASFAINLALLAALAFLGFRIWLSNSEMDAWARYAGKMQAHADFGNGVRRFYRPTVAKSIEDRGGFDGEHDGDAEIWSWIVYAGLGSSSQRSAEAFTEAYNRRMREYIAKPELYKPHGVAANRSAD